MLDYNVQSELLIGKLFNETTGCY